MRRSIPPGGPPVVQLDAKHVRIRASPLALRAAGLPNGAELRAYLADALIRLGREAEAKQVLPSGGEAKLPRF